MPFEMLSHVCRVAAATARRGARTLFPQPAFFPHVCVALALCGLTWNARANTLQWNTNRNRVSAELRAAPLDSVLKEVSAATGWSVYLEPDTSLRVSAKFKDLPPGQALPLLLGRLNFALAPGTNASSKLFVFRTSATHATQLVPPEHAAIPTGNTNLLANELIVRLKPGAKIDELAAKLGAKVKGRIEELGTYRLEFADEEAAEAARQSLATNEDVQSVDDNFSIDRPISPSPLQASTTPPPVKLQLKPPPEDGRVIVGLIDTAVQPLGNDLDSFILKQISVAGTPQLAPGEPSHGTSMAETILRSLQAITKGSTAVQILPVDVYGANPSTSTFDVANGIVQAVNGGAKIVNLSLGSEADSPFLKDIIAEVSKKNIPIFAAAGNEPVTTPFYPAAYPGVTAVTAVEQGQLAPYASRGSFVDVAAPGTSVVYYNNQPYYVVGTSAAAAFTSGIAAGYLDSTGNSVERMRSFITNNFGVKLGK